MAKKYWLMKTEPDNFSIDDLENCPKQRETWDGVRNYQARNFMRDEMKKGDMVFIYHSSCKDVGIAGLATVSAECMPDDTSFDPKSRYYDPKSTPENPRWFMVEVEFVQKFEKIIPLKELKSHPELDEMHLVKKGSRLSISPVSKAEYDFIKKLSNK